MTSEPSSALWKVVQQMLKQKDYARFDIEKRPTFE